MSRCNIASAGWVRPARTVRQNEVEEFKISSKVLCRARLEVCQMGNHILDIVANGA